MPDEEAQIKILQEVCNLGYTVKQTENRRCLFKLSLPPMSVKVIIRDVRIFLNTIRQAVSLLESGGLGPRLKEKDCGDYLEITICVPKNKKAVPQSEQQKKETQRAISQVIAPEAANN